MIVEIVVVNGRADLGHVGGKNASPTIYLGSGHGIIGGGSALGGGNGVFNGGIFYSIVGLEYFNLLSSYILSLEWLDSK